MERAHNAAAPQTRARKLLYLVTEDWYFCSHRLPIARAARDRGFEVVVATRVGEHADQIRSEGFRLIPLPWRRRSKNPVGEIRTLAALLRLYRSERPDIVHHVALKPVLYGGLIAALTHPPAVVNAVTGFGYVFTSRQLKARVMRPLFRAGFRGLVNRANTFVIIQNPDDGGALVSARAVDADRLELIRGSGVDVRRFFPAPAPDDKMITVTMVSRMLWSKGVGEIVEAARILRAAGTPVRVQLVGDPDVENPESVGVEQLREWQREGIIKWVGHQDDVPAIWRDSHVAVLPSYREGLPMSLMEAAACGRPLVATDVPGCREVVIDGGNGLLVPVQDAPALATAIGKLAHDAEMRQSMGDNGRKLVVESFSQDIVVDQTMALYDALLERVKP